MVQDPTKLKKEENIPNNSKENDDPNANTIVDLKAKVDPVNGITNGAASLCLQDSAIVDCKVEKEEKANFKSPNEAKEVKSTLVKEWVTEQQFSASADWAKKPDSPPVGQEVPEKDPVSEKPVRKTTSFADTLKKKPCPESPTEKQTNSSEASDEKSDGSGDSGRGASLIGSHLSAHYGSLIYEFEIPQSVVGLFIGRQGRTVGWIERKSGATVMVRKHPFRRDYQICSIEGTEVQIDRALDTIAGKFQELDLTQVNIPDVSAAQAKIQVSQPEVMQLTIPEGVSIEVVVSNIVSAGHIFIQQPTHPSYMSLERLNFCMSGCYSQGRIRIWSWSLFLLSSIDKCLPFSSTPITKPPHPDDKIIPQLPRPIEVGVICACSLQNSWYRAQVVNIDQEVDEADIRYLDYGGYQRVKCCLLRQIRRNGCGLYLSVEVYLGNIAPLDGQRDFSVEASALLEELTRGRVLQCHAVAMAEDHSPFVELLTIEAGTIISINRELVARGVVQWAEATELSSP